MTILRRDCPHCPTDKVAFTLQWQQLVGDYVYNCAATCGACGNPICFLAAYAGGNSTDPMRLPGSIEPGFSILAVWPQRTASAAPAHTPDAVRRRYIEGEDAYKRHSWNAAVAMYRSALDIATKAVDGVPKNLTFFKRLQWLAEKQLITPEIRSWADHVRVEGNEALHDPDEFIEDDARPLRFFTEMFLRYVFELPGEVKAFRGEVEGGAA
jgi:hypothetical protein